MVLQYILDKKKTLLANRLVGVSISKDGISMAYVQGNTQDNLTLQAYYFKQTYERHVKQQALIEFVERHQLQGVHCCYVLPLSDYLTELIEAPKVLASEMSAAIKWSVKEFIDYPIENAIIDAFELPLIRASDKSKMAYVVIMHRDLLPNIESLIQTAKLKLKYIDIQETCIRNLAMLHPKNTHGALALRVVKNEGNIIISKKENLLMGRRLEFDVNGFSLDKTWLEKLALELQRSMDYCSGMFNVSLANNIILLPSDLPSDVANKYLNEYLGVCVYTMNLAEYIQFNQAATLLEQKQCLIAIGGALHEINLREVT